MIVLVALTSLGMAPILPAVFLYIGPDAFLPLTSALAAVAGVLMLFWQRVIGVVNRVLGRTSKTEPPKSDPNVP
jgi:hypothetical protein